MTYGDPDACPNHAFKRLALFDRGVGAYRRDDDRGAQMAGAQDPRDVPSDPAPLLVGNERPVRIPVGRYDRVHIVLLRPLSRQSYVRGSDGLRVDRNEVVAIPDTDDFRSKLLEYRGQQIATDPGVTVKPELRTA